MTATYNDKRRMRQPWVLAPINIKDRVVVSIYDVDDDLSTPVFDLVFFGIPLNDFYVVPGGADPIFAALEKRGFDTTRYRPLGMFDVRAGDNVYRPAPPKLWP